jgi:putative ATP-dependent endonuclease of the OLD family
MSESAESASAPEPPFVPIYLHRIRIRDFGPIVDREIFFERGVTVLLGDNNVGKSSVLRAIQLALGSIRPDRSDIRCANDDGRPVQQPCAVIDIQLRLTGDPDSSESIDDDHRDSLERVANILGSAVQFTITPEVNVRAVITSTATGDADDATIRRIFMTSWTDLPAASTQKEAYLSDDIGEASSSVSKVLECFNLDGARNIATEVSQRRSNWGKVVSDGGFTAAERIAIETDAEALSVKVRSSGKRLTVAAERLGALSVHFRSAVRKVELNSVSPDADTLARQTDLYVQDKVGPIMPMHLQGSGIRSAASILSFDARVTLHRGVDQFRTPVLLLEEPETHLHPVAQRSLAQMLMGLPGQVIMTSHSPSIATELAVTTPVPLTALRILRTGGGEALVRQILAEGANLRELAIATRLIRANQGECFFSSAVIVVEGVTEQSALPVFADAYFDEPDSLARRAVTIIAAGSKDSMPGMLRSIAKLGVPAIGLVDADGAVHLKDLRHEVSNPDWEGALVAAAERLRNVVAFATQPAISKFVSDRIKSAKQELGNPAKAAKAQKDLEGLQSTDDKLKVAGYLRKKHRNETSADVVKHIFDHWPISEETDPSVVEKWPSEDAPAPDLRFPDAVMAVLKFVDLP